MTSPTLQALDRQIINTAKEMFFRQGIIKTEMKEIAKSVGISRSTLYRHFESTLSIAFYITEEVVQDLTSPAVSFTPSMTGYEQFANLVYKMADKMCDNLPSVRFLSEFDTLYNVSDSSAQAESNNIEKKPAGYEDTLRSYATPLFTIFRRGIRDGSIAIDCDTYLTPLSFFHTALALAKHIVLREENYMQEHGVGRELMYIPLDMMLKSIRPEILRQGARNTRPSS